MSIVAVHGPHTFGSTASVETGYGNAVPDQANGMVWVFSVDANARPAADFDWDFGANATPATTLDSKGPITVTYSVAGTKTVTLTVAAGAGPPAGGTYVMGIVAKAGPT